MDRERGRDRFKVWPVRSKLSDFEYEQRALQRLASALGEPVTRAPTPGLADGILLCSGGVEQDCVALIEEGASRVLLAGPDYNAYAAGAEVVAYGQERGMFLRLQPVANHLGHEIRAWMKAQRVLVRIREARVGVLGGSAPWLVSSVVEPETLSERLGATMVHVPWVELSQAVGTDFSFRKAPDASRWTSLPRDAAISSQDMRKSLGFSAAIDQIVRERGFDAVALDCFEAIEHFGVTGCLALADLNEVGIPAACEGDIVSAITMLFLAQLTGQPVWMANLGFMEETSIWLSHCTLAPSLAETSRLRPHFESGKSVSHAATLPAGQMVTVARLDHGLTTGVVVKGRTREGCIGPQGCRTQVCIELERPLPRVLGNHHVMAMGDHTMALTAAFMLAGVEVLA